MTWKIYYTVNNGECDPEDCNKTETGSSLLPATTFSYLTYSFKYVGKTTVHRIKGAIQHSW